MTEQQLAEGNRIFHERQRIRRAAGLDEPAPKVPDEETRRIRIESMMCFARPETMDAIYRMLRGDLEKQAHALTLRLEAL